MGKRSHASPTDSTRVAAPNELCITPSRLCTNVSRPCTNVSAVAPTSRALGAGVRDLIEGPPRGPAFVSDLGPSRRRRRETRTDQPVTASELSIPRRT